MNPNDLTLENTHSSKPQNISETLLKHGEMLLVQTGSWNWLVCRMRAVGVWRIIPRIRTGLKPLDHQPSTRLVPIVPLHQASLRLHNLPLSAVEEIPGTSAKTHKTRTLETFENLSNLSTAKYCTGRERKKALRPTTSDAGNQLGGELVDAGGSALTATARTARHARFSELWLRLLARFLYGFNVRENSSMLGWARLYCERRNTIHTILEHSKFSSWHLGFAVDYDHRHHSKFGTKHDRMSWMKNIKHYVRDYS